MITGLRYDVFHSTRKKRNNKDSIKNIDMIDAFLFSLIIVHGTYVLGWEDQLVQLCFKETQWKFFFFSEVFPKTLL